MLRIKLPLNISYPTVNAYLLRDPVPTLVDCGLNTAESIAALSSGLADAGLRLRDIRRVFITHPHVDHIGLAGILAENGAEIWLSKETAAWMTDLEGHRSDLVSLMVGLLASHGFDQPTLRLTEGFYIGMGSLFSEIQAAQVRVFEAGQKVNLTSQAWQVLPAPGHTNRQVCFYQPESGELFSADMLLPKAPVPVIEGRQDAPSVRSAGLPELLESYRTFRALEVHRVYPGHGEPFQNHQALIDDQVARIHQRKEECLEMIAEGITILPDLLARMYAHLRPEERLGGLAMLVGYLDLLQAEGRVLQVVDEKVVRFKAYVSG